MNEFVEKSSTRKNQDTKYILYMDSRYAVKYTQKPTMNLDKNGVLRFKPPFLDEFVYISTHIARYGFGNLEMFLDTGVNSYKQVFLTQGDWLFKNLVVKDGYAVWENHFKAPYYDCSIPWISGLGQGLGMIALLEAYHLNGDDAYLDAAKKVFRSFEVDIRDGGVRFVDDDNNIWLEERPMLPPPHILNGFITNLFSILKFYQGTKYDHAHALWKKGIKTLNNNLEKYDLGYWSRYELNREYPSTINYHTMHVKQLNILYELTGETIFSDYARLWQSYLDKWVNRNRAQLRRGVVHLKRHGLKKGMELYFKKKKLIR